MTAADHRLIAEYLELVRTYAPVSNRAAACPICGNRECSSGIPDVVRLKGCEVYVERPDPLVVCDTCGLLMRPHVFPPAFYFEYLNRFYDCVPDVVDDISRWKAAERTRILRTYTQEARSVLEVSSYDGATLAALAGAYGAHVVGVEPTMGAARLSESTLPPDRARIINDVIERAVPALDGHRFDLVVFSHSFRHISTPDRLLDAMRGLTAPDAVILVDESDLLDLISLNATPELAIRSLHVQKQCYYAFHNLVFLFERFGFHYLGRHMSDDSASGIPYCGIVFRKRDGVTPDRSHLAMAQRASRHALGIYRDSGASAGEVKAALLKWG